MTSPQPEYEQQIARHAEAHRQAARDSRYDLLRTSLHIALSTLGGLALIGLAFHADEHEIGRIFFVAGEIVWIGGFSLSLLAAYRRGERRGDW